MRPHFNFISQNSFDLISSTYLIKKDFLITAQSIPKANILEATKQKRNPKKTPKNLKTFI